LEYLGCSGRLRRNNSKGIGRRLLRREKEREAISYWFNFSNMGTTRGETNKAIVAFLSSVFTLGTTR